MLGKQLDYNYPFYYEYSPVNSFSLRNQINNYTHPVLYAHGQFFKMVSLFEFMERIAQSSLGNVRNCNNKQEVERFKKMQEVVEKEMDIKEQVTFWNPR
jgi:hypothetical protein